MISTLHIKNIGIIDDITVEFNEGFNVLTGETGAGKTLIIDALNIISGGRFSKEMMRHGEIHSFVEALIYMPDNSNAIDGNIIVSREIYLNGRNSCKINGRLVTVNELKNFMEDIIDIHGQNDTQKIMNPLEHIKYLDNFIGKEILSISEEYRNLYAKYCNIKVELSKTYSDDIEKQRMIDLLIYQLNEIQNTNLKENEDIELEEQRNIILNSEKIIEGLSSSNISLENTIDNLNNAIRSIEKIENIEKYVKLAETLRNALYDIEETNRDIIGYKEDIDFDEKTRNDIENRYDEINTLKRKYGNTIKDILVYADKLKNDLSEIQNVEERIQNLKFELDNTENRMRELAQKMHTTRIKYSKKLSDMINNELFDLEMKQAKFKVEISEVSEFNKYGLNKIEFLICTNTGDDYKPLIKIASGGEISRIMLAIKSVLSDTDNVSIMVFDEIDKGISGKAAKSVGEKMSKIAEKHQIFVITHLAVIAAFAKNNFYIYKNTENNKTKTNIRLLKEEETIQELARILTGEITEIAIKNAIELRKSCCLSVNREQKGHDIKI